MTFSTPPDTDSPAQDHAKRVIREVIDDANNTAGKARDVLGDATEHDEQMVFDGIDATIGRLDVGIAIENESLDALLDRLSRKAA